MSHEIPEPNPPLSPEEESAFTKLPSEDLEFIDATVLSCARPHWQKVAMVVSRAKEKLEAKYPQFSHTFYAMRVQALADAGRLESQGDLDYMRFSEVRFPDGIDQPAAVNAPAEECRSSLISMFGSSVCAPRFNRQKGNIKIIRRDVGLLALGFVIGAIVTVSLTRIPTRPSTPPAPGVVLTGRVVAAASVFPSFFDVTLTNIEWQARPVHIVLPPKFIDSFDSHRPLDAPMQRNFDLIDMRYQPDIDLGDLK